MIALAVASATSSTVAQPLPGGSLDPLAIPKYVSPLVIPPVMPASPKTHRLAPDYIVSMRQFQQQVLPSTGCTAAQAIDPTILCNGDAFPVSTLWGYGTPGKPLTAGEGGSYFNPSFTIEVTKGRPTRILWKNELIQNPAACTDPTDPNNPACNFLPHLLPIDQTLHWANPPQDCFDGIPRTDCAGASGAQYTGPVPMIVHVHGSEVRAESDGYPEAWYLPAANNIPAGYATEGTYYSDITGGRAYRGKGAAYFAYPNAQPSTTLWYHDHSLGITRNNVYAASAGFFLIRDPANPLGETGLKAGILPKPAPVAADDPIALNTPGSAVRNKIREIPIAIQDRAFNTDGSLFYPANRAFFEGLGDGQTYDQNDAFGLLFPFLPDTASDISPVWNPEAFFNTFAVNGKVWPQLEVAQQRYRLRLLNANDSRFLNLSLWVVTGAGADGVMGTGDDTLGQEIPFYQIGAEQSLLPQVVRIETGFATPLPGDGSDVGSGVTAVPGTFAQQALLMGPAERADTIADFGGLPNGTVVRMLNTAPDAPFGGFPDAAADPLTTGQVMQFVVNTAIGTADADPSTPAPSLQIDYALDPALQPFTPADVTVTREVALLEEESALICYTIDADGNLVHDATRTPPCDPANGSFVFGPKAAVLGNIVAGVGVPQLWDDFIEQNPAVGAVEQWDMWNLSADAHPIHIHQVKFRVVEREEIGGAVRPAEPWEAGWKDTVIAYPNEITRVQQKFDLPGLYVWHCHILSHEDNEMMVPFCVGTPGVDCPRELFRP